LSTVRVLPSGSSQKAAIVDISFIQADHVDALKSSDPTAFRRGCQIQAKEQTPGFAFLLQ